MSPRAALDYSTRAIPSMSGMALRRQPSVRLAAIESPTITLEELQSELAALKQRKAAAAAAAAGAGSGAAAGTQGGAGQEGAQAGRSGSVAAAVAAAAAAGEKAEGGEIAARASVRTAEELKVGRARVLTEMR